MVEIASSTDVALSAPLAVLATIKGMIGAGILSLPYVFNQTGLIFAVPGFLIVSALCAFSVWRMIECKRLLLSPGYAHIGAQQDSGVVESLEEPPKADDHGLGVSALVGSALGPAGVILAGTGVLVTQCGAGIAYIDVVTETLGGSRLLGSYMSAFQIRIGIGIFLGVLAIFRDLGSIAKLSGLALFVYAYLLVALVWRGSEHLSDGSSYDAGVNLNSFGLWFGTTIFAQEAIILITYIYEDMRLSEPKRFIPVLVWSFSIASVICAFVGAFGALCYGDKIEPVFYMNFPKDSIDLKIAEVVLCFVLLISFVLQLYPVNHFLEQNVLGGSRVSGEDKETQNVKESSACFPSVFIRWTIVVVLSVVAACISNVSCVMGYTGSFAISLIGFFLPSLCHVRICRGKLSVVDWIMDVLLFVSGVLAVVFGVLNTSCS
jgi:amino acid permease